MKNSFKIYIGFSLFILLLFILGFCEIYLKGVLSVRIILWVWLITTLFIIIKNWKTKGIKIYTILLSLLTVLSILPMGIPFMIMISFLFNLDNTSYYQLDNTHELKKAKYILSKEKLYVIEQQKDYFIFEKTVSIGSIGYEEVLLELFPQNSLEINPNNYEISDAKLANINEKIASIKLTINNKSKLIEIPINQQNKY